MKCRHCQVKLKYYFIDLCNAPPSNAYLNNADLIAPELTIPLRVRVCHNCWLVQTEDYAEADQLFASNYAYFSSTSKSWLKHASGYVDHISDYLNLNEKSLVIEIGSNDGYLLKNFIKKNIPCLGIEPTDSTADLAEQLGIPVWRKFFNTTTAKELVSEGKTADLICGNNVYAHVPDINDFTEGLRTALKPNGTINLEFPHILQLINKNQFDTIYHEHYSYLSLTTVSKIFRHSGLRIYHIEEIPTHGGSLRIYGCHEYDQRAASDAVDEMLAREQRFGLLEARTYTAFQAKANKVKDDFLSFLLMQKKLGNLVAAYGAAAKGNTLMNYAGVKNDLINFICDASPSKQYMFMPGSHIPIFPPTELKKKKPKWIIIFPWNIADEIILQEYEATEWGGEFIVFIPELKVLKLKKK